MFVYACVCTRLYVCMVMWCKNKTCDCREGSVKKLKGDLRTKVVLYSDASYGIPMSENGSSVAECKFLESLVHAAFGRCWKQKSSGAQ